MIPFEEIDQRLKSLDKDRTWLAQESQRSEGSIRSALAPKAHPKQRSELLQKALTDAIEREESRHTLAIQSFESQQLVLRPSDEEYRAWSQSQRESGDETLSAWAASTLNRIAEQKADQVAIPLTVLPPAPVNTVPNHA